MIRHLYELPYNGVVAGESSCLRSSTLRGVKYLGVYVITTKDLCTLNR